MISNQLTLVTNQITLVRQHVMNSLQTNIDPINKALKNLTHKTVTNHEVLKTELKKMEQRLEKKMEEHNENLTKDIKATGNCVQAVVKDIRKLANGGRDVVENAQEEEGNNENSEPVVYIEKPNFYDERRINSPEGSVEGWMTREEILFLIRNIGNSQKVHKDWTKMLKDCNDPITFLLTLFEEYTFDSHFTPHLWTRKELLDEPTGK